MESARNVVHLELGLEKSGRNLAEIFAEIELLEVLGERVPLRLGHCLEALYERGHFFDARVEVLEHRVVET